MSASSRPTFAPSALRASAKFTATVDLPTPPLPEATAIKLCAPGNGFNVGSQGATYAGVCPPAMEKEFLDAYSSGHRLYELESAAYEAQSRVDYAHAELDQLRRDLAASEASLVSGQVTTEQRVQLALDIKDMAKRQGEVERSLVDLQRDADRRYAQLARYRSRLAYNP